MNQEAVGEPIPRREDRPLLTGQARFTDDHQPEDLLHAAFLRSQYAHADIEALETAPATALEGVNSVLTGADLRRANVPGGFQVASSLPDAVETRIPLLANESVRYNGEALAVVLAEDRYTARDGVEAIEVRTDRRPAVVDPRAAARNNGPVVHEAAPDNVSYDWTFGEAESTQRAFDTADRVASVKLRNQRLIGDPIEPRSAVANVDDGELTVTLTSQSPFRERPYFAEALGLSTDAVRIIAPSVGGGFGVKGKPYADEIATAWCAMETGRPVKWTATRSESHVADYHSRDWYLDGELAVDAEGTIRGLRITGWSNLGAYYVHPPSLSQNVETLSSGQYAIPAIHGRMVGTFTHTTPIGIYRGAGRPEAIHLLERLIDQAAVELGIDPATFRRRNLIPADAFPYETAVGSVYDSGDYERALNRALEAVDYEAVRDRQRRLRSEGRYLGIGLGCFVENSGSSPGLDETARVELRPDGHVDAYVGTHDHGQGHRTTFAQVLTDALPVGTTDVRVHEGDTADLPDGTGTFGSRSAALGGAALSRAAAEIRADVAAIAADALEVSAADLSPTEDGFHVEGAPDRTIKLDDILTAADTPMAATADYDPPNYGYSFGTHVAVVEVDPETGHVDFEKYVAVDDCGRIINPTIVDGQIHGGVAQGIAEVLREAAHYDESGSLLTGTLQDYALPKAADVPEIETAATITPSPHNPLGVKGTGESGTIGAVAAVSNAVVDALRPFGVTDVPLPMTPERIWSAIES